MNQITEQQKLFNLIAYISDHYAAKADAKFFLKKRLIRISVEEGGKTLHDSELHIDNPAIEAKARLIRHDLERLVEDCELPILHREDAA
jgi:hypothetical protein